MNGHHRFITETPGTVSCAEPLMSIRQTLILFLVGLFGAATTHAQTVTLAEDFDGATPPAGPAGWTLGDGWSTSTSVPSSGSGLNNLVHSGSQATSAATPPIDLSTAAFATLTYLARRTSSYDPSNLRVTASIDGGASFAATLLGGGAAVPAAASTYELISVSLPSVLLGEPDVVIRFEGQGLNGSSSNARIDDVVVAAHASGSAGGTLGFRESGSTAVGEGDTVAVPIVLDFTAPPGLQGVQFRVSWSLDSLQLVEVVPNDAIADESIWSLSFEPGTTAVDVVLLGEGTSSLPSGTYDALLTLRLRAGSITSPVNEVLSLSGVVGALATPEGSDAGIILSNASYELILAPGAAAFHVVPTLVDFGLVSVGETDTTAVTVTNLGGTRDLQVTGVTSTNPLFTVLPNSGVVAPHDSMQFAVMFAPVDTAFGLQEGEIRFHHTGADTVTAITIIGKGRGGRGDAEGDGSVDVLDIVHAIDFVLARNSPGPAQTAAADLFPFPAGDELLDVRDLTVLSQGVARGRWPDGVLLPVESAAVGKSTYGTPHAVLLTGDGYELELRHDVPIRAFQLIVPAESPSVSLAPDASRGLAVRSGYDHLRGELRIVGYDANGEAAGPGVQRLTMSTPVGPPRYVTVIGEDRGRIAVDVQVPTRSEHEAAPVPEMEPPYPNPFRASGDLLRVAHVPRGADVEIFDVLGRIVLRARAEQALFEWDGRDAARRPVAPGLYITRIRADGIERAWAVVVTR